MSKVQEFAAHAFWFLGMLHALTFGVLVWSNHSSRLSERRNVRLTTEGAE